MVFYSNMLLIVGLKAGRAIMHLVDYMIVFVCTRLYMCCMLFVYIHIK